MHNPHDKKYFILPVSATSKLLLQKSLKTLLQYFDENPAWTIDDIAYTLQNYKETYSSKLVFICQSLDEFKSLIQQVLDEDIITNESEIIIDKSSVGNFSGYSLPAEILQPDTLQNCYSWTRQWLQQENCSKVLFSNSTQKLGISYYAFSLQSYSINWSAKKTSVPFEQFISINQEDSIIADHVFDHKKLVPAIFYIKHILDYTDCRKKSISLKNLNLSKPLYLDEKLDYCVKSVFLETNLDQSIIKIYHQDQQLFDCAAHTFHQPIAFASRLCQTASSSQSLNAEQVYEIFIANGIQFGKSYQNINDITFSGSTVLASVSIEFTSHGDNNTFALLIDSAMQVAAMYLLHLGDMQLQPESIENISLNLINSDHYFIEANFTAKHPLKNKYYFDVNVYTENGTQIASLNNFLIAADKLTTTHQTILYKSDMVPVKSTPQQELGKFLVLTNNTSRNWSELLGNKHTFRCLPWNQIDDLIQLDPNLTLALDLTSLNFSINDLAANNTQIYRIVELLQRIEKSAPRLKYSVYLVADPTPSLACCYQKAFYALLNVFSAESSLIDVKGVFCGNKLVMPHFELITTFADNQLQYLNRLQGSYLIVGASRGLGKYILDKLDLNNTGCTFIVVSRYGSADHQSKRNKIVHWNIDVAASSAQEEIAAKIKENKLTIRGVMYSAGIVHDRLLINKSLMEFTEVVRTKINGIIAVDKATEQQPLAFFMVFSSLAAHIRNPGQSDYAYANAFVEYYINYRQSLVDGNYRKGMSLAISWPALQVNGMAIPEQTQQYLREQFGLEHLENDKIVAIIDYCLTMQTVSNVVVFHGEPTRFSALSQQRVPANSTLEMVRNVIHKVSKLPLQTLDNDMSLGEYGIDSIVSMRIFFELEQQFPDLPRTLLIDLDTINQITDYLNNEYKEANDINPDEFECTETESVSGFPLTELQQAIYFAEQSNTSAIYNIAMAHKLEDEALNVTKLESAILQLYQHNPILLNNICSDELGMSHLGSRINHQLSLPIVAVSSSDEMMRYINTMSAKKIDLENDLLCQFILFEVNGQEYHLLLFTHHLICDAKSVYLIWRQVDELYHRKIYQNQIQDLSYFQYLNEDLQSKSRHVTELPDLTLQEIAIFKKNDQQIETKSLVKSFTRFNKQTMLDFCRKNDVTLFSLCFSAFVLALNNVFSKNNFFVALALYGRNREEYQNSIGCFTKLFPYLVNIDKNQDVLSLCKEIYANVFAANAAERVNMQEFISSARERYGYDLSIADTLQVYFTLQTWLEDQDLQLINDYNKPIYMRGQSGDWPFSIEASLAKDHLSLLVSFNEQYIMEENVQRVLNRYEEILSTIILSNAAELTISQINNVPKTILLAIVNQAITQPNKTAVTLNNSKMSYHQLLARVEQLKKYFLQIGIRPQDHVAVLLPRDHDLIPTLLAIWSCQAVYIPLDPIYPTARLQYILQDSQAKWLINKSLLREVLDSPKVITICLDELTEESYDGSGLTSTHLQMADQDSLAYIIYTSGSTGDPKGVMISCNNLNASLFALADRIQLSPQDRLLALTTVCFDISILELILPLLSGSEIILAETAISDGLTLNKLLDQHDITYLQATPSMWEMLVDAQWPGKTNLIGLAGGEALPKSLCEQLLGKVKKLINIYGPTETTIWISTASIENAEDIPLGLVLGENKFYLIDEKGEIIIGEGYGELYISGPNVADGYWNNSGLSSEKFITALPQLAACLYKTGDLVQRRANGQYYYLNRTDEQCKIRGFRIELSEIEYVLMQNSYVKKACVKVLNSGTNQILSAYIQLNNIPEQFNATQELLDFISNVLPHYMIPQQFHFVTAFNLLPNGKIDKKNLEQLPKSNSLENKTENIEEFIYSLWGSLLHLRIDELNPHKTFFEFGGNSLLLNRMLVQINAQFKQIHLSMPELFNLRNIDLQVKHIREKLLKTPKNIINENQSMQRVLSRTEIRKQQRAYGDML